MKQIKKFDSFFLSESKSSRWPDLNNPLYLAAEKEVGKLDTKNIELAFSRFPVLSSIGDESSYARYLETIFPDSIVKDIVYNCSKSNRNTLYFATKITHDEICKRFGNFITVAKVNLVNPDITLVGYQARNEFDGDGYITLCEADNSELQFHRGRDLVPYDIRIKNQEQVHILGSEEDIENFANFVKNNKV